MGVSSKLIIMAGLAVVFGTSSYYAGNQYLENQSQARLNQIESENGSASKNLGSVVVATQSLKFGEDIVAENLKLVAWPAEAMPEGAYTSIEDVIGKGKRRAIKSIEANEPVLAVKLTGEDGRAGLAGIISPGMRAVTIPVDNVKGVGGFVQPGDFVDIVFTKRDRNSGEQTAKILMDKVKVLSIDQQADARSSSAKVAKTVTLETDTKGAQQLALATNVGRLSLLLRSAGDESSVSTSSLSFGDISSASKDEEGGLQDAEQSGSTVSNIMSLLKTEKKSAVIRVVRGDSIIDSTVPIQQMLDKAKTTTE